MTADCLKCARLTKHFYGTDIHKCYVPASILKKHSISEDQETVRIGLEAISDIKSDGCPMFFSRTKAQRNKHIHL